MRYGAITRSKSLQKRTNVHRIPVAINEPDLLPTMTVSDVQQRPLGTAGIRFSRSGDITAGCPQVNGCRYSVIGALLAPDNLSTYVARLSIITRGDILQITFLPGRAEPASVGCAVRSSVTNFFEY